MQTIMSHVVQARTKDDALIVVKLMIFFELRDIDKMVCVYACIIINF